TLVHQGSQGGHRQMSFSGSGVAHQQQALFLAGREFAYEAAHLHKHCAEPGSRDRVVLRNLKIVERGVLIVGRDSGVFLDHPGKGRFGTTAARRTGESGSLYDLPTGSITNGTDFFRHGIATPLLLARLPRPRRRPVLFSLPRFVLPWAISFHSASSSLR